MGFPLTKADHDAVVAQIEAMPELVIAVAIRTPMGVVTKPRPARHADLFSAAVRLGADHVAQQADNLQGFITSHGRFVDRAGGARLALASGQTDWLHCPGSLFSEDLWNDPNHHHTENQKARWRAAAA